MNSENHDIASLMKKMEIDSNYQFPVNKNDIFNSLINQGYDNNQILFNIVLIYDNVEYFEYLYKNNCKGFTNENNIFYDVCQNAYDLKSFKCLKFLVNNGFSIKNIIYNNIIIDNIKEVKFIIDKLNIDLDPNDYDDYIYGAIDSNDLKCLQYVYSVIEYVTEYSCSQAARKGNLSCLEFLHGKGGILNDDGFYYALNKNNVECIIYYNQYGFALVN